MKIKTFLPFYPTETKVPTQIKTALTQSYTDKSFMYYNSAKRLRFFLLFVDYLHLSFTFSVFSINIKNIIVI